MSTKRSYKAEFLRWKAEVEKKHGKMIYDRLSEVIDTDDDLAVGDTVLFTNDYGVTFGPHEVLGFCRPDSFLVRTVTPRTRIAASSFQTTTPIGSPTAPAN